MKKELIFLTIIVISAVLFFALRKNVVKNSTINQGGNVNNESQATVSPGAQAEQPLASEIPLTIIEPTNNSQVNTPNIIVRGKTAPGAEVMVNDIQLKGDAQGNFSTSIILDPGDNTISVVANDAAGNYSEKEILVTLQDSSISPQ